MNKEQSIKIVQETFQKSFDKERFLYFIKNLLNNIDETKAFQIKSGQYIKESFRDYIDSYERLATFTDPEDHKIDILIVYLQKEVSLSRARTAQRNFVAQYLKGRDQKDAGLVAFVSPKNDDWRFSLVKMDYKFIEGKGGQIKVEEEFTPAKRWSFLVGRYENSHTAQSRLVPIMMDDKDDPNLVELEEAFNIEKVTKEFFEKYRDLFHRFNETLEEVVKKDEKIAIDFKEKNVSLIDFSKKLLGQIVFLYFLQKKGWFGVPMKGRWGEGDKQFLRTLFEKSKEQGKNYFNDFLEPLFYEALAKERDDDYYSMFNCRIPFLNGGLFDPISNYDWVNTIINIPNEVFSNDVRTKEGDVGSGILDIFDRYNFTVKEDEPLEKEVAIDPEMLGKVFENLLNIKDRKSKGTYYTPREIVHYMCQQSLLNYLVTELENKLSKEDLEKLVKYGEDVIEHETISLEKKQNNNKYQGDYKQILPDSIEKFAEKIDFSLSNIKVCDPAIGSGAFPVGMMNEVVRVRTTLNPYLCKGGSVCANRTNYDFKFECIHNSLYGVDIDPGAVEIAKLRLWLSLMVDEDNIKSIKPLPNLDYKIMQGNSLLEEYEEIKLFDEKIIDGVDDDRLIKIEKLNNKHDELQRKYIKLHNKNQLSFKKKERLNNELNDVVKELKRLKIQVNIKEENGSLFDIYKEAKIKADLLKKLHKDFFAISQKRKKDELKRQIEELEWDLIETTLKEQGKSTELKKIQEFKRSNIKPWFLWKLNFADVFEEKNGFDVVIGNPPYVRADSPDFKKQREAIMKSGYYETLYEKWDLFVPFIEKGLKVSNKRGFLSYITSNSLLTSKYAFRILEFIQKNYFTQFIDYFDDAWVFEAGVVPVVFGIGKSKLSDFVSKRIHKGSFENNTIKKLIALNDFKEQGKNAFKFSNSIIKLRINAIPLGDICYLSYGLRPNSDERFWKGEFTRDDLVSETRDKIHTKSYVEGKNIDRYRIDKVLFLEWGTKRIPKKLVRPTFSDLYTKPKLMRGIMTGGVYDDKGIVCNHSIVVFVRFNDLKNVENRSISGSIKKFNSLMRHDLEEISQKFDLKYLLAIINSKFAYYYLNCIRRHRLENYFYPDDFRNLPIPDVSNSQQKLFVDLVDQILNITKMINYDLKNPPEEQKRLEAKIDEMVFDLYDLTKEEREIILKS